MEQGNLGDHDAAVRDLTIGDMKRAHALGLHKPTRFSLDPRDKKHLLWCKEYFVGPDYVQSQGIKIGKLGTRKSSNFGSVCGRGAYSKSEPDFKLRNYPRAPARPRAPRPLTGEGDSSIPAGRSISAVQAAALPRPTRPDRFPREIQE